MSTGACRRGSGAVTRGELGLEGRRNHAVKHGDPKLAALRPRSPEMTGATMARRPRGTDDGKTTVSTIRRTGKRGKGRDGPPAHPRSVLVLGEVGGGARTPESATNLPVMTVRWRRRKRRLPAMHCTPACVGWREERGERGETSGPGDLLGEVRNDGNRRPWRGGSVSRLGKWERERRERGRKYLREKRGALGVVVST